jgi:hypothetical protein
LKAECNATLFQAKDENSNPFYTVPQIKKFLIFPKVKLETVKLRSIFLDDIESKPENKYIFSGL